MKNMSDNKGFLILIDFIYNGFGFSAYICIYDYAYVRVFEKKKHILIQMRKKLAYGHALAITIKHLKKSTAAVILCN